MPRSPGRQATGWPRGGGSTPRAFPKERGKQTLACFPHPKPMARRIIPPLASRQGGNMRQDGFVPLWQLSLRDEFHSSYGKIFLAGVAITTAPIRAMLYDSPHAQEKVLGRNFRRISHGPAIRHHQPLRPGLQLGRNHRWPRRNVDRRRSFLCAANGRLALHATRSEDSSMRSRLSALAIILCGTLAIWLAMAPQQNFQISPVPPGADWTA